MPCQLDRRAILGPFLLGAIGCGENRTGPSTLADLGESYVPAAEWRTATPAAAGFDPDAIETLRRNVSGAA